MTFHNKERLFEVYMLTNVVNGKKYVGKSVCSGRFRWKAHRNGTDKRKSLLARAINKHGTDSFALTVLYQGVDDREILMVERAMIAVHNTFMPCGYNMTIGGEGAAGAVITEEHRAAISKANKGRKRPDMVLSRTGAVASLETRKKMGDARRGKKHSPEHIEKIRITSTGRKHSVETRAKMSALDHVWNRGVSPSEETRRKISQAGRGRVFSEESRLKKSKSLMAYYAANPKPARPELPPVSDWFRVLCRETGQLFKNSSAADKALGFSAGMTSKVVSGKYPHAKGLTFEKVRMRWH